MVITKSVWNIVDHKGENRTYNVHSLYYQESDGHLQGVAAKQVTLLKTAGAKTIPAQGSYVFQKIQ